MTTTTLDYVSHDLEMMMPGSQLMLTGGAQGYQTQGGMQNSGGMMGGNPMMGGNSMMGGGFNTNSGSPYPPQRPYWSWFSKFHINNLFLYNQNYSKSYVCKKV